MFLSEPAGLGTSFPCRGSTGKQAKDFRPMTVETRKDSTQFLVRLPGRRLPRIVAVITVAGLMALAACHTTAGAGKDISAAGNAITKQRPESYRRTSRGGFRPDPQASLALWGAG